VNIEARCQITIPQYDKMKNILTIGLVLMFAATGYAQDHHLSQFYAAPLTLNPALTGSMSGKYRATAQYRNQWQTVMDNSFKTMQASFDIKTKVGNSFTDNLGFGMYFYGDKGGTTSVSTNHIAISASYHKGLGLRKKRFLSAGFNIGVAQKNINYNNLTFNDQFDGTEGYNLGTGEELPTNNRSYSDLSAGVNYTYLPRNDRAFNMGASIFHANSPNVSLDEEATNRLPSRFTIYASGELPINERVNLLPRALVYLQGNQLEANIGTNVKFKLGYENAFHLGGWFRPVSDVESGIALDAFVVLVGFETETFIIGLSTDANLSTLMPSSSGFGGFELSLTYVGRDENDGAMCPTF